MKNSRKNQLFRRLVATTLLLSGMFQLAAPVLAQTVPQPDQDTTAGTVIRNTATGTYVDPNQPGQTINTTSNTVTITVAEVAGITVVGTGATDANGGTLQPNDLIQYNFTVTNVGNDATKFFIPGTAAVSGPGTLTEMRYSTNGGQTYPDANIIPAAGVTTGSINAGESILVQVRVRANASATANTPIAVTLGNTDPVNGQNVPVVTDAPNDVRTVDNRDAQTGEAAPTVAPANGEQEASATQSTNVGAALVFLNGPNNQPAAVGPGPNNSNNEDFTNASTPVPAGIARDQPIDPGTRTITNTIKSNSTTDPGLISLLPTVPAEPTALPDGTLVTIVYGTQTAVYEYDQPTRAFTFVPAGSTGTGANDPVEIDLPINGQDNYQVTVDLPSNTAQFANFPVPITAFIDNDDNGSIAFTDANTNGRFDPGEANYPSNTTINRLYTGFLELTKASRILQGTGPAVPADQGSFQTSSTVPRTPAPGNIIEYRITYDNISNAPAGGSGNVILNASSIVITENGTTGTNTWALDSDTNGTIDTSGTGTPTDNKQGSIAITTNTDGEITQYVNTVPGQIAPNDAPGQFIFQRQVN